MVQKYQKHGSDFADAPRVDDQNVVSLGSLKRFLNPCACETRRGDLFIHRDNPDLRDHVRGLDEMFRDTFEMIRLRIERGHAGNITDRIAAIARARCIGRSSGV